MSIINCPECNKGVSDTAVSCPHCGYLLNKSKNISKKKTESNGCLIFSIIILIIVYIIYNMGNDTSSNNSPTTSASSYNNFLAYSYAEDFVKKQLKSPSTAKFPGIIEKNKQSVNLGGGTFKIDSWVDSQNSFGAMIRTNFSCIIVFKDGSVSCKQLKIE